MRLFISIQLNDAMRDALTQIQHSMQRQGVRGNFTREENLHLTLAFIGEYPDPYDVKDIIDQIEFDDFAIKLEGLGSFGRLWWAGISESGDLKTLAKRVRRALADAGIPFDRKKFSPHITLVRKPEVTGRGVGKRRTGERRGTPEGVDRRRSIPEAVLSDLPAAEMTVDHISLMRSERGRHGMIYTEL